MPKTTFENVIVDVTVTAQASKEIRRARDFSLSKINRMETAKMHLEFRALSTDIRKIGVTHACPNKSLLDIEEMHNIVLHEGGEGEGKGGFMHIKRRRHDLDPV